MSGLILDSLGQMTSCKGFLPVPIWLDIECHAREPVGLQDEGAAHLHALEWEDGPSIHPPIGLLPVPIWSLEALFAVNTFQARERAACNSDWPGEWNRDKPEPRMQTSPLLAPK